MRTTVLFAFVVLVSSLGRAQTPNVVLVVSDDQGFGDFSSAGHGALETPNLDRLRRESPRVERFYVSPVCSPTRACLMTGRYNYRTRVVDTWIGRSMMDPAEVTLAEILRATGYATGIFGKWHLGDEFPLRAIDQGFEEALVHKGGGLAQPSEPIENQSRYTDPILFHNGAQVETKGFCTDVYFDAALAFIDRSRAAGRPFFCYVPTNAPHGPFHDVPADLRAKYLAKDLAGALRGKGQNVEREAAICAMVENLDHNVGRLLAHLDAQGLAEDTLVVFFNDNGPVGGRYTAGLRGQKASVYEGGIRSPLFLRWPGRLDHDQRVDPVCAHIDLVPTIAELVGVTLPPSLALDGRSLVPLLDDADANWPERALFLQSHRGNEPAFEHHFAVVTDRWKLVRASGFGRSEPPVDHPFELFDLERDPFEERDLSAAHPDVVTALRERYRAWFEDVSTTRGDNFDPPRIVVDAARSPFVTLTRQDLRADTGEGWDNDGWWWLETERELAVDVVLIRREPPADAGAVALTLRVGDGEDRPVERPVERTFERDVEGGTQRAAFGRVELPAGRFRLRAPAARDAVHQVVLRVVR